jgi:hypothetical protein
MNKRIEELAKAAGLSIRGHYDESGSTPAEIKKFAELIVQECADVCLDRHHTWRWGNEPDSLSGPRDCAQSIKEHFGVGE